MLEAGPQERSSENRRDPLKKEIFVVDLEASLTLKKNWKPGI